MMIFEPQVTNRPGFVRGRKDRPKRRTPLATKLKQGGPPRKSSKRSSGNQRFQRERNPPEGGWPQEKKEGGGQKKRKRPKGNHEWDQKDLRRKGATHLQKPIAQKKGGKPAGARARAGRRNIEVPRRGGGAGIESLAGGKSRVSFCRGFFDK